MMGRRLRDVCLSVHLLRSGRPLDHETVNDAVEQEAVIEAFVDEFDEVCGVERRVVVEQKGDVAHSCMEHYFDIARIGLEIVHFSVRIMRSQAYAQDESYDYR